MENSKLAHEAHRNGKYTKSGHYYTQAAYSTLAQDAITKVVDGQIAGGLSYILQASYEYRRAQKADRAKNRCKQGILIASDIQNNDVDDTIREGILLEYIGDFRVIGNIQNPENAYEEAAEKYSTAGIDSSFSWPSNPLVDENVTFLTWLHRESNTSIPKDNELDFNFSDRISYKKSNMSSLLDKACK